MKTDYIVILPNDIEPAFPFLCFICGEKCSSRNELKGNIKINFWGRWQWLFGRSKKLEIPSHNKCINELKRQRAIETSSILASFLPFALIKAMTLHPILYFVSFIFVTTPICIFFIKKPLPFDFREFSKETCFEFRNEIVAKEFADLNGTKIR